jgi:hypothetical protein
VGQGCSSASSGTARRRRTYRRVRVRGSGDGSGQRGSSANPIRDLETAGLLGHSRPPRSRLVADCSPSRCSTRAASRLHSRRPAVPRSRPAATGGCGTAAPARTHLRGLAVSLGAAIAWAGGTGSQGAFIGLTLWLLGGAWAWLAWRRRIRTLIVGFLGALLTLVASASSVRRSSGSRRSSARDRRRMGRLGVARAGPLALLRGRGRVRVLPWTLGYFFGGTLGTPVVAMLSGDAPRCGGAADAPWARPGGGTRPGVHLAGTSVRWHSSSARV